MTLSWKDFCSGFLALDLLAAFCMPVGAVETAVVRQEDIFHPAIGQNGTVATQQR